MNEERVTGVILKSSVGKNDNRCPRCNRRIWNNRKGELYEENISVFELNHRAEVFCKCGFMVGKIEEVTIKGGKRSDNLYDQLKIQAEDEVKANQSRFNTENTKLKVELGNAKKKIEELEAYIHVLKGRIGEITDYKEALRLQNVKQHQKIEELNARIKELEEALI